ncbi:MAG: AraC family transcriptional regulator [Lachnospiraceae bacterium]|nr:AraC family transcriptional regulator [Lachnospiraceae bacterium]
MEYMEYLQLKEGTTHGDFLSPLSYYELNTKESQFLLPMHWHEEIEVTYIESGSGSYVLDLCELPVSDGDILVIPPGTLHSSKLENNSNIITRTFVFHLNMLNSLQTDACAIKYFAPLIHGEFTAPIIVHRDSTGYDSILQAFSQLLTCYREQSAGYELAVKSYLLLLFYQMFHHNIFQKKGGNQQAESTPELLKKVINYIHTNYAVHITVADLAALCDFSEYHFMRFFKRYVGMTCIDYINNYRLDVASVMLKEKNSSIMEIALDAGFNNISYFNKLFKSKFHVTPSEYRRLITEMEG